MKARRTPGLIILAIMLCIALWPGHVALGEQEQNLLTNGGFEELDESGQPVGWTQDMYVWDAGVSVFEVSEQGAYDGQNCVSISSGSANDARYAQTVPCERSSIYRLSGWVRAEGVPEGTTGVNLSRREFVHIDDAGHGHVGRMDLCRGVRPDRGRADRTDSVCATGILQRYAERPGILDDLSLTKVTRCPTARCLGCST